MADHDLHNAIMNIPCHPYRDGEEFVIGYKFGHRDARHAAAELALASPPVAVQEEGDAKVTELCAAMINVIAWVPGREHWHTDAPEEAVARARKALAAMKGDQP